MERLHSLVKGLSRQFAAAALAERFVAILGMPPNSSRIDCSQTSSELCRFERTSYRFEIYCNVCRIAQGDQFDQRKQMRALLDSFSPWENEQLACIHDFLFQLVSPAYNEVAEHDITWGAAELDYPARRDEYFESSSPRSGEVASNFYSRNIRSAT